MKQLDRVMWLLVLVPISLALTLSILIQYLGVVIVVAAVALVGRWVWFHTGNRW